MSREASPRRVYMDHAATTPVDPQVVEAMLPYFQRLYGNASSLHTFGQEAYEALEEARKKLANLIGAKPPEIAFTSGGTEADNLAIKGVALKKRETLKDQPGPHIITSTIEHPAVLETTRYLEGMGFKVKYLPVNREGTVDPNQLNEALTPNTFLITIMHANNEIGTIQPIEEIGKIAKEKRILFHVDAVQSTGKIPIDVNKLNVDLLTLSSHKIYGPKGVGALYVRRGTVLEPLLHGGGHERGLRSSTENIPGIVGFGKAAELAAERLEADGARLGGMKDHLLKGVLGGIEASYLTGHPTKRLPHNASLRFKGIEGEALVLSLDEKGIAASTGSACSSKKLEPSHVLIAIGLNEVEAHGSLRLTLGRGNSVEDADYVLTNLIEIVANLRKISPLWGKEIEIEKWRSKMAEEGRHSEEVEL